MSRIEELLKPCAALAHEMLEKEGSFAPFGCALRRNGSGEAFLSDDGDTSALKDALRAGLESGEFELTALVEQVSVRSESGPVEAIRYCVGASDSNKQILVPFCVHEEGIKYHPAIVSDSIVVV